MCEKGLWKKGVDRKGLILRQLYSMKQIQNSRELCEGERAKRGLYQYVPPFNCFYYSEYQTNPIFKCPSNPGVAKPLPGAKKCPPRHFQMPFELF